jgi:hypothetical protein
MKIQGKDFIWFLLILGAQVIAAQLWAIKKIKANPHGLLEWTPQNLQTLWLFGGGMALTICVFIIVAFLRKSK